jgi:hypothetical protein
VVGAPLLGCVLRTLETVVVATGMGDAVRSPAGWALIQTRALVAALAVLEGADDLAVGKRQLGGALQVCGGTGGADVPQGGHDSRPCMSALRRSEASSWPW